MHVRSSHSGCLLSEHAPRILGRIDPAQQAHNRPTPITTMFQVISPQPTAAPSHPTFHPPSVRSLLQHTSPKEAHTRIWT